MGRWAQRQRGGGGRGVVLTEMAAADLATESLVDVGYTAPIDVADFSPADFQSMPSATVGFNISQINPSVLEIDFSSDVSTDTSIEYSGTAPQVLSPQTIPIS